ncbi:Ger(x)C family spore germination protein [Paenibacillus sp. FSL R5-0527]|uniref:Ger(x)C family spore germination protein n=1 Tax=Paenibacillus sp. FSL R5-0527 TaxID=2975321 RepID=UPI000979F7C6|nr:hypothetical protein BK140_31165 [Paenibacillus macerans]
MRRWGSLTGLLLCLALFATGCWDRVEIEERGFVVGAGIDVAGEDDADKYILTFQFVIPGGLQGNGGGEKDGGKSGNEAYFNLSSSGNTMFRAARDMSYRTSRSPYLQHIRMIIISDRMAREAEFSKALDLFLRDHEMRRATKIMVAEGDARAMMNIKPKNERLPIAYFESVAQNPTKSSRIYPPTSIGEMQAFIIAKQSFALPRMQKNGDKVSVSGAAVFNGETLSLQGYLNDDETSGLNVLRGTAQDGVLEFKLDNDYVAYEIKGSRRRIYADVSNPEHIRFRIQVNMEGNVGETQERLDLMNPAQLAGIEGKAAERLTAMMKGTLEKVQLEYKSDVIGLGTYLKQEYPAAWKKIQNDWDRGENYFSQADIELEARVKVRIFGSTIETK